MTSSLGYSQRRSRASRKPWPECPDLRLFRCPSCGNLYHMVDPQDAQTPSCCAGQMEEVPKLTAEQAAERGLSLSYEVAGGLNDNVVKVTWNAADAAGPLQWIMLKTFTGFYMRYPGKQKKPPMIFPLADEDAYVYCDREVCLKCVFRCKLGFIIYAYFQSGALVELPLDQMGQYFKTNASSG